MSARRLRPATISAICLVLGWSAVASAQSYPSKPIHLVVPVAPGGITDVLARALGQKLTEAWGQQVVIENKPAGAGQVGTDSVAKSAPDGHTLLVAADATFVTSPHTYSRLPYDPIMTSPRSRARHQPTGPGGQSAGAGAHARRVDELARNKPRSIYGPSASARAPPISCCWSMTGASHAALPRPTLPTDDRRPHPDDDRETGRWRSRGRRVSPVPVSAAARGFRNTRRRPWRKAACPATRPAPVVRLGGTQGHPRTSSTSPMRKSNALQRPFSRPFLTRNFIY